MFQCLYQPDLYVNLYYVANIKIKKNLFQSLCQPDLYVNLYYIANIKIKKTMSMSIWSRQPCYYIICLIFMSTWSDVHRHIHVYKCLHIYMAWFSFIWHLAHMKRDIFFQRPPQNHLKIRFKVLCRDAHRTPKVGCFLKCSKYSFFVALLLD